MQDGETGHCKEPEPPYYVALTSYLSFALLYIFGHVRDLWRRLVPVGGARRQTPPGYAPLCKDMEDFYTRRLYLRIHDVFNRPIASAPDAWIEVCERQKEAGATGYALQATQATRTCLNLGSYNYLGFAAADPYCTQRVRGAEREGGGPPPTERPQPRPRVSRAGPSPRRAALSRPPSLSVSPAPPRPAGAGYAGELRREHVQARPGSSATPRPALPAHASPSQRPGRPGPDAGARGAGA